jgi:hypothetical protein
VRVEEYEDKATGNRYPGQEITGKPHFEHRRAIAALVGPMCGFLQILEVQNGYSKKTQTNTRP